MELKCQGKFRQKNDLLHTYSCYSFFYFNLVQKFNEQTQKLKAFQFSLRKKKVETNFSHQGQNKNSANVFVIHKIQLV